MNGNLLAEFWVFGKPMPKGSGSRMANGAYLEGGTKKSIAERKAWKESVKKACSGLAEVPLTGPMCISLQFYLSRPKSKVRAKETACSVRPDLDKLERGVLDPMTWHAKRNPTGLLRDDSSIVHISSWKYWTDGPPGVHVMLFRYLEP